MILYQLDPARLERGELWHRPAYLELFGLQIRIPRWLRNRLSWRRW